jgi:hypothetical protein
VQFAGQFSSNYEDYEDIEDDDLAPVAMPDSLLPQKSNFQPVRSLISAPPLPPSMTAVPPPSLHGYQRFAEPPQRQTMATNAVIAAPPEVCLNYILFKFCAFLDLLSIDCRQLSCHNFRRATNA